MAQAQMFEYEGKMYTTQALAKLAGVHHTTMYLRLRDHRRDPAAFPVKYVMTGKGYTGVPSATIRSRQMVLREEGLPRELATMNVWSERGNKMGKKLRKKAAKTILKSENKDVALSPAPTLNIANFRKQYQISQRDLAEIAGVSQFTISVLERGVANSNATSRGKVVEAMRAIAKAANPTKRPKYRLTKPGVEKKADPNWLVVNLNQGKRDEMKKLLSSLLEMLG